MAKTKGAKNKSLEEKVAALAKKYGKEIIVKDDKDAIPQTSLTTDSISFEVRDNENKEEDLYECGHCQRELNGEIDTCPYCGSRLTWQE